MAKSKDKVNLSSLSQTHGALAPMSIEELTGQVDQYTEGSVDEYRQTLATMSDEDMREHAIEKGEVPIHTRSLLIDRLERRFITASRKPIPRAPRSKISKQDIEFQRKFLEGN